LKKLEKQEYYKIYSLIPFDMPNRTVVESVIIGSARGDIWVDDVENATCMFVNTGEIFSFVLGFFVESFLFEVCIEARNKPSRYLYLGAPPMLDFFEVKYNIINMVQFFLPDSEKENIKTHHLSVPKPYFLSSISNDNFNRCNWYELLTRIFGDEKSYFKYAKGYCISDGDKIISESHTGYISDNKFEIATVTVPEYQKKNLSYIVCLRLLNDYMQVGQYHPVWSCEERNTASMAVAKKLGFRIDKHYSLIKLF
jgi:hypothetical protein